MNLENPSLPPSSLNYKNSVGGNVLTRSQIQVRSIMLRIWCVTKSLAYDLLPIFLNYETKFVILMLWK